MNTAGDTVLTTHQSLSAAAVVVMFGLVCYVGGRVHQYFKQGLDREHAYREGYNLATRSLFALATRTSKALEAPPPLEPPPPAVVKIPPGSAPVWLPQHRVDTGEVSAVRQGRRPSAWQRYRQKADQ